MKIIVQKWKNYTTCLIQNLKNVEICKKLFGKIADSKATEPGVKTEI